MTLSSGQKWGIVIVILAIIAFIIHKMYNSSTSSISGANLKNGGKPLPPPPPPKPNPDLSDFGPKY